MIDARTHVYTTVITVKDIQLSNYSNRVENRSVITTVNCMVIVKCSGFICTVHEKEAAVFSRTLTN